MDRSESEDSISVNSVQFSYPGSQPLISEFTLKLKPGSRCLLVGANGAGKSTLLRIIAGKHMVGGKDAVTILGRSAFHDTKLVVDGTLCYLGGSWTRSVGCAGEIPLQGDFSAEHMIFGVTGVDPDRRDLLIELLDIDLQWRMNKVSDGQRRRVQICMGLLRPFKVLLLDEITVDLDVVARCDLLEFFKQECEVRGATLIYATHIFDGLETWATELAYVENGQLKRHDNISSLPELRGPGVGAAKNLIQVVEPWLHAEKEGRYKQQEDLKLHGIAQSGTTSPAKPVAAKQDPFSLWGASSRQMAYYR